MKGNKETVELLYRVPIAVPHIVAALLVYNIFSQTGILPRILFETGLIKDQDQFPSVLYEPNGSWHHRSLYMEGNTLCCSNDLYGS